jgi:hypothetical protein
MQASLLCDLREAQRLSKAHAERIARLQECLAINPKPHPEGILSQFCPLFAQEMLADKNFSAPAIQLGLFTSTLAHACTHAHTHTHRHIGTRSHTQLHARAGHRPAKRRRSAGASVSAPEYIADVADRPSATADLELQLLSAKKQQELSQVCMRALAGVRAYVRLSAQPRRFGPQRDVSVCISVFAQVGFVCLIERIAVEVGRSQMRLQCVCVFVRACVRLCLWVSVCVRMSVCRRRRKRMSCGCKSGCKSWRRAFLGSHACGYMCIVACA